MANKKISELDGASLPLGGGELFAIVQSSVTKQTTLNDIIDSINDITGGGGSVSVIPKTFTELKDLVADEDLVPGSIYEVVIHTKHVIINTSPAVINTGDAETVWLQAISPTKFAGRILSLDFPLDIIEYDFNDQLVENGSEAREGRILYRKDMIKNLSTFYDFRNVKFRRYDVKLLDEALENIYPTNAFYDGTNDIVKDESVLYHNGVIYLAARSGSTLGYTPADWKRVIGTTQSMWNVSLTINSYLTLAGTNATDVLTFDGLCENVQVGKVQAEGTIYYYNNITFHEVVNITIEDNVFDGIVYESVNMHLYHGTQRFNISWSNRSFIGPRAFRTFLYQAESVKVGSKSDLTCINDSSWVHVEENGSSNWISESQNVEIKCSSSGNYLMRVKQLQVGRFCMDNSIVGITVATYYPPAIANGVLRDHCTHITILKAGDYATMENFEFEEGCHDISYSATGSANVRFGKGCQYMSISSSLLNVDFGHGCSNITIQNALVQDVVFGPGFGQTHPQRIDGFNLIDSEVKEGTDFTDYYGGTWDMSDLVGRSQVILSNPEQLAKQMTYITRNGALEALNMEPTELTQGAEQTGFTLDIAGFQMQAFTIRNNYSVSAHNISVTLSNPHADYCRVIINVEKLGSATDRTITIASDHVFNLDGDIGTMHRFEAVYSESVWTVVGQGSDFLQDGNATVGNGASVDLGGTLFNDTTVLGNFKNLSWGTSESHLVDHKIYAITGYKGYGSPVTFKIEDNPGGRTSTLGTEENGNSVKQYGGGFLVDIVSSTSSESETTLDLQPAQISITTQSDVSNGSLITISNSGPDASSIMYIQQNRFHLSGGGGTNVYIEDDSFQVNAPDSTLTMNSANVFVGSSSMAMVVLTPTGHTFEDNNSTKKGLQYAADYKANYVARSLIDFGYVQGTPVFGTIMGGTWNGTAIADGYIASAATWNAKEDAANKNVANGYAGLDANSKINPSQLPAIAITNTSVVASQAAMLALTAETGDIAIRSDLSKTYILKGTDPTVLADWELLQTPTDAVSSVFGRTGAVTAQSGDYTFAQLASTPTTLAGYGITDAIDGSGTADRVARFTDSNTVAAGAIRDDGTTAAINTAPVSNTVLTVSSALPIGLHVNNTAGGTSNIYTIIGQATGTNTGSNCGVWGNALNSSGGTNLGVRGSANAHPVEYSNVVLTPGSNVGGFFQGNASGGDTAYGVVGSADVNSSESVKTATFIGGFFKADRATTKYAVQLVDGTEGTGKFLKSVTSDGKANWAAISAADLSGSVDLTSQVTGLLPDANISSAATWNGKVAKAGDTMTGFLTLHADPTNAMHAATKGYIDNLVTGLQWKPAVRVATTANITLSGAQTIDGVLLVADDRVLVKNQSTDQDNGIYVVSLGSWTRATDANSDVELQYATVLVDSGTVNANTQWTCVNTNPPTIGTDSINFTQIAGAGVYTNGTGLLLTGNAFSIDSTVATLTGTQTLTNKTLTAPTINGGTHTALTALGVRTTGTGAFDVKFATADNLTADRTVTFATGNASRQISLSGDLIIGGSFTTVGGGFTLNTSAGSNVTLPASGTLATLAGTETLTNKTLTSPTINGGSHVGATSFSIKNTGAPYNVSFSTSDAITADRILTLAMNDASHFISLQGSLDFGNNFITGNNQITLSTTNTTNVTLPTTGTLATLAGAEALTNKTSFNGLVVTANTGAVTTGTWNGTAVDVAHGGTGAASATAYAVQCGGTTSTGAHQSVSGVGTSGQILTSNGASALPTWQSPAVTTLKQSYQFSLNGDASSTYGFFTKDRNAYSKPTTDPYNLGLNNNNIDPYVVHEASTVTSIRIVFAHAATGTGAVGGSPTIRIELYKMGYSTRTQIGVYDIAISGTGVGTWGDLSGNAFQTAVLNGLSTSLSAGDIIGIQFTNLSSDDNKINALGGAQVSLLTTIN